MQKFKFKAKVWVYPDAGAWYFASLPKGMAADLKKWFGGEAGGFGSLPVKVELGESSWKTSVFWDSKTKTYLLPLKVEIRKKEQVVAQRTYTLAITILL